jgi:Tol biopolymer transport system component
VFVRDRVAGTTERVSVADDESQLVDDSGQLAFSPLNGTGRGAISDDGRYVVFVSRAANVVGEHFAGDNVYVRDLVAGATELVNVALDGTPADSGHVPDMSPDGRFITFYSRATDLVPVPPEQFRESHIYVRDRTLDVTERVSVKSDETFGNFQPNIWSGISGDGRYVVFASEASDLVPGDTNGTSDIFLRDRLLGTLDLVSRTHDDKQTAPPPGGSASSHTADLSDDGRYVAFVSGANNLIPADGNGLVTDLFTRFVLAPIVARATPSMVGPGPTQLTVHGTRFLPGATVDILGAGVALDGFTRVDESRLLVDVTVAADAAPGVRFLRVTNPGTGPGASRGGFDVCACFTVG